MSRKKFTPSQTKKEISTGLAGAPARDDQSITLPVSTLLISQNPRTDLRDLAELKNSIADRGILNPLLVAKTPAGFELLGGHRRLECAKLLGITDVPCRVVTTDEPEVVKLIDNVLHQALSPIDEIAAVARLAAMFNGNQVELAKALGKSKSYVSRCLKAAMLPDVSCAGATLSKSALFELADALDPTAALAAAIDGKRSSIREARADSEPGKPPRRLSGPIAGGRYADPVKFRETKTGWTLRVIWDPDRAPVGAKEALTATLERLLARLKK